ncbi:MAG TPA: enoyl-CoA hydratase/isomerase family protein [Longimicrobiaceae bacterium]|nr:enoyl-CoA hydratase/isomerase family protein [Longimicrobiaceae bacterium]
MLERELSGGILTLRLAHGKANALDDALAGALVRELRAAESDGEVRAVVLTGTGSMLSAGVDLFRLTEGGAPYVQRFFPLLCEMIRVLFELPKPVVVAANGHAIAGGCLMLWAGDVRLIAEGDWRIGVPELLVGVPFPAVPLEVVRFAVSPGLFPDVVFRGRTYLPTEALRHGFVDEVVAPGRLRERAREIAAELARVPAEVFSLTKRYLRADPLDRLARHGGAHDREALRIWSSPDTLGRVGEYVARTVRRPAE